MRARARAGDARNAARQRQTSPRCRRRHAFGRSAHHRAAAATAAGARLAGRARRLCARCSSARGSDRRLRAAKCVRARRRRDPAPRRRAAARAAARSEAARADRGRAAKVACSRPLRCRKAGRAPLPRGALAARRRGRRLAPPRPPRSTRLADPRRAAPRPRRAARATLGADAARACAQRRGKTPRARCRSPRRRRESALPTLDAAKQAIHRVLAEIPRGACSAASVAAKAPWTRARPGLSAASTGTRAGRFRFAEGEAWTSVAFNTAPAAAGRQHSTWVAAVAFDA